MPRRATAYSGPDFRKPAERPAAVRGLTERIAEKAAEAVQRPRFFAPSYGLVPQVDDRVKEGDRG